MGGMTRCGLCSRVFAAAIMSLLCPSGCVLAQFRQQAVEYSLAETAKARDEIVSAAKATRAYLRSSRRCVASAICPYWA